MGPNSLSRPAAVLQLLLLLLFVLNRRPVNAEDIHLNEVSDNCDSTVEECSYVEEEECGVCHSMYMRECNTNMEYMYMPKKVRECKTVPCNMDGFTERCVTKHITNCTTSLVYRDVVEERPVCGVQAVQKCANDHEAEDVMEEGEKCREVKVMRCRIEKKTIRKEQPETSCTREPTQICTRHKCKRKQCYERVRLARQLMPKERCAYKEKRVCQETESADCRTVLRRQCKTKIGNCEKTDFGNKHRVSEAVP